MAENKKERRSQERYVMQGCAVRYKTKQLLGLFNKVSKRYMALDISQGGINFITREGFKLGLPVSLIITAPLLKEDAINAQGRVAWVKPSPELRIYNIGIEFTSISDQDKTRLKNLVDSTDTNKTSIPGNVHLDEVNKL
ncbi:MAG: PilZ domain-containing protein [Planctomycetota bacterium]